MLRITALRGRPAEPGDRPGRRDDDRGASNAPLAALVAGLVGGLLAVVSGVALPRALAPQESPLSPEQSQVVNYDQ
jgi:hypothetical protein